MERILFTTSIFIGFFVYWKFSKPKSKLFHSSHLVPNVELKHIELFPCLRIPLGRRMLWKRRQLHIHHWIYLSFLLMVSLLINNNIFGQLGVINGFCIGGIIQGLTFKDKFKLED